MVKYTRHTNCIRSDQRRENTFGKKCFLLFLIPSLGEHLCDNKLRESIFSVRSFGAHFFICCQGGIHERLCSEKITDITGVELTPGKPIACLGNGEQGFACCCDECDYFLFCFVLPSLIPMAKKTIPMHNRLLWKNT